MASRVPNRQAPLCRYWSLNPLRRVCCQIDKIEGVKKSMFLKDNLEREQIQKQREAEGIY